MRILTAALVLVALSAAAGCGSASRGAPFDAPVRIDSPRLAMGERVFMRTCNPCHPGGEAGVGPALNNKPLPAFLIRLQVRKGFGAMPAFSRHDIDDRRLDALVAYLKALRDS